MRNLFKLTLVLLFAFGLFHFSFSHVNAEERHSFALGFTAQPGSETGSVLLKWHDVDVVENYNVLYGTSPGDYEHGAAHIGDTNQFLVRFLNPGQTYYFTVAPVVGGQSLHFVPEVSSKAAGSGVNPNVVSESTFSAVVAGPSADEYGLRVFKGDTPGQVHLEWENPHGAHIFHVVYGDDHVHEHGAMDVGRNSHKATINELVSGREYFFSVVGEDANGHPTGGFSDPVAQIAR